MRLYIYCPAMGTDRQRNKANVHKVHVIFRIWQSFLKTLASPKPPATMPRKSSCREAGAFPHPKTYSPWSPKGLLKEAIALRTPNYQKVRPANFQDFPTPLYPSPKQGLFKPKNPGESLMQKAPQHPSGKSSIEKQRAWDLWCVRLRHQPQTLLPPEGPSSLPSRKYSNYRGCLRGSY